MGCGWDGNELDGKIFEGWDADGVGCRWLDGTNRDVDEDRKTLEGMKMQMGWVKNNQKLDMMLVMLSLHYK